MSKMRATIRIYEDPKDLTSADVWEGTSESAMTRARIYAVMGLFSMATITAYAAWKFSPLSFGFGKSVSGFTFRFDRNRPTPTFLVKYIGIEQSFTGFLPGSIHLR
ncbi:hypothetical protein EV359DRAFT_68396 [Lentinula novae-zelandiae]|nr:hypothetical protein EV359DRAFT_68396 [Lentinula novae-zelandiae]